MKVIKISELNYILKLLTPSPFEKQLLHPLCTSQRPPLPLLFGPKVTVETLSPHTMCFILIRIKARRNQFLAAATSNQQPKFYQLPFKTRKFRITTSQKKNSILCARRDRGEQLSHSLPSKSNSESKVFREATNCTFMFYLQNVILHRGLVQEISPAAVYIGEMLRNVQKGSTNK